MGWETRANGRKYFYRGRKIGGRVVKEYFGAGPVADLAALQLEACKMQNRQHQQNRKVARDKILAAEKASEALGRSALKKTPIEKATPCKESDVATLAVDVAQRVQQLEAQRRSGNRSSMPN